MITKNILNTVEAHIHELAASNQIPSEAAGECICALYRLAESPLPAALLPFRLLLVEEAAQILRVTEKTIHDYFNNGELDRIKLGYRATRVSEEDLKDLIKRRRFRGKPNRPPKPKKLPEKTKVSIV